MIGEKLGKVKKNQIISMLEEVDDGGRRRYTNSQIARLIGCVPTTVRSIALYIRKKHKSRSPLEKFHLMEKAVNQLKPPELILNITPPRDLVELHRNAKYNLDLYVASIGSKAFDLTFRKEETCESF